MQTSLKNHMRRHGIMDIKDSILFKSVKDMNEKLKQKKDNHVLSLKMEYGTKWSEIYRLEEIDRQQKEYEYGQES